MGIGVNLFGIIDCPGYGWQSEDQRVLRHNRRVIEHLPDSDPEWPFITRSMFSLLPLRTDLDVCIPQYENQLIHFAGSYKNMYVVEAEWLTKFESLLSRLCFCHAKVINDFSALQYQWSVDSASWDGYRSQPPLPPSRWHFSVAQIRSERVSNGDAISGSFASKWHVPESDPA